MNTGTISSLEVLSNPWSTFGRLFRSPPGENIHSSSHRQSQKSSRPPEKRIYSGYATAIGPVRTTQEDICSILSLSNGCRLYAIYDGHGGVNAAVFAERRIPQLVESYLTQNSHIDMAQALARACTQVDKELQASTISDGSTVLILILTPDQKWVSVNIGDCEGFIGTSEGYVVPICPLGPHNPSKNSMERARAERDGGTIVDGRLRCVTDSGIVSSMGVSRSIGDKDIRKRTPAFNANPDVSMNYLSDHENFIVMASDGLWDVLKLHDVNTLCNDFLRRKRRDASSANSLANYLMRTAYTKGSTDNVSVIVILFDN